MKRFLLILFTLSLFSCSTETPKRVYEDVIEITEINPNRLTALTKQNLFHLAKVYDLKPFLYTKKIQVQSYVIPHSHPVLTLNTRNAEKPNQLLSTWLHEEFHWWTTANKNEVDRAIAELKKTYPKINHSSYLHLIVCYLEHKALVHYLGKQEAHEVINGLVEVDKIYPWIYGQVLQKNKSIGDVLKKHKLIPPPLN